MGISPELRPLLVLCTLAELLAFASGHGGVWAAIGLVACGYLIASTYE